MRRLLPVLAVLAGIIAAILWQPWTASLPVSPPAATLPAARPAVCAPAPDTGHLGVCIATLPGLQPRAVLPPAGPKIPDTYEGQGCVQWGRASGISGAIVKAYEAGYVDHALACNVANLRRTRLWWAAYAFLRPGSCTGQADGYVAVMRSVGGFDGPPIADAEVPLPGGFVACWVARVKHDTGAPTVVVYSAPGTWPGGPDPGAAAWPASYGVSRAPCLFGDCSPVAWQYTDRGCWALMCGDLSVDYGITKMLAHPPAPPCCALGQHGFGVWVTSHRLVLTGWLKAATSTYTPMMKAAVRGFQRQHRLKPATGTAGPRTRALLLIIARYDVAHHRKDR
jgi:hypothetical protein